MRILILLFLGTLPLHSQTNPTAPQDAAYPALQRFIEALETTRARHPDLDKISYDRLINQALSGMLSSLDPHSSFIHPEMKQLISKEGTLNNQIPSLGLSLAKDSKKIFISAIEKNGPAANAGITPLSTLLKINGTTTTNTTPLTDILASLQQPPGAKTTITITNPQRPGELQLTLSHRYIEERSLIISAPLPNHPKTGYLRLAQFGPGSSSEIETALDQLEDSGITSLILDLRENGGGDLHQTVKILGLFLPPNTTVVSIRERGKDEEFLKTPTRQRRTRNYPLSVLIDKNSASASELTAGTLHDLKRATIIGEKSYGKGSVQNIIPMGNQTALRLTIATYHTPSGNTPHLKGITPEIKINFTQADRTNFTKSGRPGSLTPAEQEQLSTWQDPAITAALKSLKSLK